jgi:small subunit ribosomal protein S16
VSRISWLTDYLFAARIWHNGLLTPGRARRPLLVRPAWPIRSVRPAVPRWRVPGSTYLIRWEKSTAVAVKIKLKRLGKIREPYYRIVVADARTKRDGRAIEEIGKYHPKHDPSVIEVDSDRVQYWLSVGAQPTDPVRHLLEVTGDWQKFKGLPGTEGTLKTAEPKADKKERYEELVKVSLAAKEDAKAAAKSAKSKRRDAKPAEAATSEAAPEAATPETVTPEAAAPEAAAPEGAGASGA